jgi:Zn-dependent protease with chaperone function
MLALETNSAWVLILAVSLVTLPAVLILRRLIDRPGGFASGFLLSLPLVLPLVAAVAFERAVLPEVGVLRPAGSVLQQRSEDLLHLLFLSNGNGRGTLYALTGSAGPWLVLIGVCVSSFMLLRRAAGHVLLRRLVRNSTPADPIVHAELVRSVAELSWEAGLKREPEVLILPDGPMGAFATGALTGRIFISGRLLERLDPCERDAVIAHELAHLQARDVPLITMAGLLKDIVAWNPVAHVAYRRLIASREFESDRRAAAMTRNPLAVASGLVKTCELVRTSALKGRVAVGFLRPGGRIARRVSALLALADGSVPVRQAVSAPYIAAACLAALIGLQVGSQLTRGESSAFAITFGSSATEAERWKGIGDLERRLRAQAAQRKLNDHSSKMKVRRARGSTGASLSFPETLYSLRERQLPKWKNTMRKLARSQGISPRMLFSHLADDLQATPLLSESTTDPFGIYRVNQLR